MHYSDATNKNISLTWKPHARFRGVVFEKRVVGKEKRESSRAI